ncbi:MAG: SDR family oxidoreductase [Chryseolinea sp.]
MSTPYKIDLQGKNVVVTGGYGHLGRGIVDSLILHGANVMVFGRDKSKFEMAFGGRSAKFLTCDLAEAASIQLAMDSAVSEMGNIDVLINNGFFLAGQSPETMSDEDWTTGIDGTLSSVFRCIRAVIPHMVRQKRGTIINVASMYGLVAPDFGIYENDPLQLNPPHYGAAKAGVLQLTRYYASYLGRKGITVNCVTPGPFPSFQKERSADFIEKLRAKTMLGRTGNPEDIGGVFVFLASDAANYITAQNFVVDGGWTGQ